MNKKYLIIIAIIILSIGIIGNEYLSKSPSVSRQKVKVTVSLYPKQTHPEVIRYSGKKGIDALTLLKDQALVEQDASGLVKNIGGRQADEKQHEFWAFYVNGKEARVGPAKYITKKGDTVEWKIAKF